MSIAKLTELQTRLLDERDTLLNRFQPHYERAEEILKPLTESESNLFKKVVLALLKIENKIYGNCSDCGEKISLERLEVKPSDSLCHQCQEKHKIRHRAT